MKLTSNSKDLFVRLASDAENWNGTPLWGADWETTKTDEGNLTDLKVKGLVETDKEEGCIWVFFTESGRQLAAELGIEIDC